MYHLRTRALLLLKILHLPTYTLIESNTGVRLHGQIGTVYGFREGVNAQDIEGIVLSMFASVACLIYVQRTLFSEVCCIYERFSALYMLGPNVSPTFQSSDPLNNEPCARVSSLFPLFLINKI